MKWAFPERKNVSIRSGLATLATAWRNVSAPSRLDLAQEMTASVLASYFVVKENEYLLTKRLHIIKMLIFTGRGMLGADTDVSVEWVRRTLAPAVANLDEFVLFCNNLEGQISLQFQDAVRRLNGIVWYGVANATDLWQPVDAGAGYLIKKLIDAEQQQWLEDDENVEKWLGNSETKLSAKERRILLTHWIGEAYRKFRSEAYAASRYRCFEKNRMPHQC